MAVEQDIEGQARGFEYERFCTYPASQLLGAEVQDEYLYLVQPDKISVYEYYGEVKKPQLIEELIYNKLILNYSINHLYICIQTSSFIEVRNRLNWNKLIHTHPIQENNQSQPMFLQQHILYISIGDISDFQFEKIDIFNKEAADIIHLGSAKETPSNPPIFVKQMGALNDLYIWGRDARSIQLGILYTDHGKHRKHFGLSSIDLKDHIIHNFYLHRVKYAGQSVRCSQYIIFVAESERSHELSLVLYQILPSCLSHPGSEAEPIALQDRINRQMQFLGNIHSESKSSPGTSNMVSEVISEAFKTTQKDQSCRKLVISLKGTHSFESSYLKDNKLWVFSPEKICQIELLAETNLEEIIEESNPTISKVIKSISYQQKSCLKKGRAVYQNNILFFEPTTSLLVGSLAELNQSIAEEIMEEQETEENGNANGDSNYDNMEVLCSNMIEMNLHQKQQDAPPIVEEREPVPICHQPHNPFIKRPKKISIQSKVMHESHFEIAAKTHQYAIQTDFLTSKVNDFDEIETLVAKYSSVFTVSCNKIKQSQFIKEKFDKEMSSIVESMAKTVIEPYLESRFITLLAEKIKTISSAIGVILHDQLEVLNESMRRIEIKENNLRGKRIYEYSREVENIKNTVAGVVDTFKAREVNRFACNQLMIEEAKTIKDSVKVIETEIIEMSTKHDQNESDIQDQIGEIMELMTKLNKPTSYVEESEAEIDHSDGVSSQGKEERRSEGTESQKSSEFQGQEDQGQEDYHQPQHQQYHQHPQQYQPHPQQQIQHPQHHLQQHPQQHTQQHPRYHEDYRSHKADSQRYPVPGPGYYAPQFLPPPPPPQTPYYYPYEPQAATVPYQPYYPPAMQHKSMMMPDRRLEPKVAKDKDKKASRPKRNR